MKLTLNQAAKECGRAKSTRSKAIKSGKLSHEKGDKGSYLIDRSELHRVFPPTGSEQSPVPMPNTANEQGNSDLEAEVKALRDKLETANLERDRERAQLTDQISDLRDRLDKEGEERRQLTAMLTDQRGQGKRGFFGLFSKSG